MTDSTPSPDRPPTARDQRLNRSRQANGALFPAGVDGRTAEARRWRDVYADLTGALGRTPGPGEAALVRRTASLAVACERLDADLAAGRPVDPDILVRLTNALARCLASLGLAAWGNRDEEPERPDPRSALDRLRNWGKS